MKTWHIFDIFKNIMILRTLQVDKFVTGIKERLAFPWIEIHNTLHFLKFYRKT